MEMRQRESALHWLYPLVSVLPSQGASGHNSDFSVCAASLPLLSLKQCKHGSWGGHRCKKHSKDVAVTCEKDDRCDVDFSYIQTLITSSQVKYLARNE